VVTRTTGAFLTALNPCNTLSHSSIEQYIHTMFSLRHIFIVCSVTILLKMMPRASALHLPLTLLDLPHISTSDALNQARGAFDVLRDASMPKNGDAAIACGISEAVSGAIGAVFSRSAATALNDAKQDSPQTKVSTTAAFFGVRGLVRASTQILGIPRPLGLVISSILASAASEATKLSARESVAAMSQDEKEKKEIDDESIASELSGSEIVGDLTKWLCFDTILEALPTPIASVQGVQRNALYFSVGSLSSTIGSALRVNIDHYSGEDAKYTDDDDDDGADASNATYYSRKNSAWRKTWMKVPKASIEGGVLFLVYAFSIDLVDKLLPAGIREELVFAKFLDSLEGIK
jgi:hypothetical protein